MAKIQNPYLADLGQNAANHVPLSPLSFLKRSDGENISSIKIEEVLYTHPAIQSARENQKKHLKDWKLLQSRLSDKQLIP